jgi:hypothetical protein
VVPFRQFLSVSALRPLPRNPHTLISHSAGVRPPPAPPPPAGGGGGGGGGRGGGRRAPPPPPPSTSRAHFYTPPHAHPPLAGNRVWRRREQQLRSSANQQFRSSKQRLKQRLATHAKLLILSVANCVRCAKLLCVGRLTSKDVDPGCVARRSFRRAKLLIRSVQLFLTSLLILHVAWFRRASCCVQLCV